MTSFPQVRSRAFVRLMLWLASFTLLVGLGGAACAQTVPEGSGDGTRVLQTFVAPEAPKPSDGADQTRRWVMFALGAPLLMLLLITAGLGIAMGLYGKQVYVAHMIFAGLSLTLAIVHAVVGLVWFRPF